MTGLIKVMNGPDVILSQSFTLTAEDVTQTFVVNKSLMDKAQSIDISVDRTFNPAKMGIGPDNRDLRVLFKLSDPPQLKWSDMK